MMVYLRWDSNPRSSDYKSAALPGLATEANIYSYLDVDSSHTRATLVTNKYIQLPRGETSLVFVKM